MGPRKHFRKHMVWEREGTPRGHSRGTEPARSSRRPRTFTSLLILEISPIASEKRLPASSRIRARQKH